MNTNDIIAWLRDQSMRAPEDVLKRGMIRAADALEELATELKNEMYRHDRHQDFEAAEAQELDKVKVEIAAMAAELKNAGGCGACKHCHSAWDEDPCNSCRQDPGFPAWEWNRIIRGG